MMDRIVPAMDAEVSKTFDSFLSEGHDHLTGTKLEEIVEENGKLRIKVAGKERWYHS